MSGLAVALGLVLFLGGFAWGAVVYRPYTVPTSSMAPTIGAGARILAERIDADEKRLEGSTWLCGIADISAADAELRSRRSRVPVAYVPPFALGSMKPEGRPTWSPSGSRTVVFLGALDVSTNYDALDWFAREVWPTVLRAVPEARWSVVGRRPSEAVRKLVASTPGAELHADVPD
ncbi:hypothetical protein, partial [Clavibacter michiganensis]|uniref:hypothetical protein n=1 Tax=Clavibacter michiganensis TaxID=28447 RepID=UPI00292DEE70